MNDMSQCESLRSGEFNDLTKLTGKNSAVKIFEKNIRIGVRFEKQDI